MASEHHWDRGGRIRGRWHRHGLLRPIAPVIRWPIFVNRCTQSRIGSIVWGGPRAWANSQPISLRSGLPCADPGHLLLSRIIPLYLIYRPANTVPYATIEEDLAGPFERYCVKERDGSLAVQSSSEIAQKCCAFQHWLYQWTNGNILVTDMEGTGRGGCLVPGESGVPGSSGPEPQGPGQWCPYDTPPSTVSGQPRS
ncbi:hypothetical protein KIL84_014257 [Mauremys mutica]|uniref:Alpha-type protein kinase domain-containing protein n=1 Tax=Mauremys mutica TaxID=74926 RepID=A0A9D3XPE9_9SAUR|nr:hypothetical protein KIL84_014257 [Mauremys mutica]